MYKSVAPFLKKLFNLREGSEDKAVIVENIKDDADFSSARFWTLVFAIGVCSVGLNINSIPLVIGAMLISPLMGPIVSIGLALSINDWGLMRRSLRNLATLTVISIGISALYFALSPITNAQSELLSRIQPTIFDVVVAIFGGMAGFISISRARYNNAIPGVAIATALMPPLCTVGYGIATFQTNFIFGAFYLFLINCIFICLSALVVASYLKLPKKEYSTEAKKVRVNRIITVIVAVIVTPAVFFAFNFVGKNQFEQDAARYVKEVFEDKGSVVVYKNFTYSTTDKKIELAFLSESFDESEVSRFEAMLFNYDLINTELVIRQNGYALSEEEWKSVLSEMKDDDEKVRVLEASLERQKSSFYSPEKILDEIKTINSQVTNIAYGPITYANNPEGSSSAVDLVLIYTGEEVLSVDDAAKLSSWLRTRLGNREVIVQYVPPLENQAI
jgi:uncharacterized hydrophobic protein (TIGR00271 family)